MSDYYRHEDGQYDVLKDMHLLGWTVPAGFVSDGCTFPGPLHHIRRLMRADKYAEGCILHDWLRRYGLCRISQADRLLREYIGDVAGDPWMADIYYLAVKLARPWFSKSVPLPPQWEKFRHG